MSWFNKLERKLEPIAITNITLYLVIGQTFVYLAKMFRLLDERQLWLVPVLVTHGQIWRLGTFVFVPEPTHWALVAFMLYFFYFIGSAMEAAWGTLRYNLFLLVGYLLTVGAAFVTPNMAATNLFVGLAVFLAFAYLNPDYEILVFFILPVKMKWLALLDCLYLAYTFAIGDFGTRLAVIAGVGNFLIFFARDLWLDLRTGQRRMKANARNAAKSAEREPRHRCYVCGKTDISHPDLDFRYCSKCAGDQCYCPEHIRNHEHVLTPTEGPR
ncbi:hypothetical protein DB347_13280 [Opitutaceae bacterium EW11]|nr:hypothetical protein DB347_13280 [Opitutaceae bacterium EW11]